MFGTTADAVTQNAEISALMASNPSDVGRADGVDDPSARWCGSHGSASSGYRMAKLITP